DGEYLITLDSMTRNGALVTFQYPLCLTPQPPGILSDAPLLHWVLSLDQMQSCLRPNRTLSDLFVSCSFVTGQGVDATCPAPSGAFNSAPLGPACDPDVPCMLTTADCATQLTGVKFRVCHEGSNHCTTFAFTLDESVLSCGLDTGCVLAATRRLEQDVRTSDNRCVPGYGFLQGPVCAARTCNISCPPDRQLQCGDST